MDLELEIQQGGQSNKLANGLQESTTNFGKGLLENAGMGISDVVAATGINIGVGSTDDIIADNISAIVNLTGEQGLTGLANNIQNYTQQLTALGLNAPEELVNIILDEITKVLAENGVIDVIKAGMQVTQGTVELAKVGLQYAMSIATIIGNIQKLLLQLNKMQDADVMCIPSVKDSLSALTASLINQLKAQYEALKQQLIIFYNSMICTSNDAVLDNIVVSVNNILEVIEPALDPLMQKYTGHTLSEIRNICNQGFAYIGMIQRAAARKRQQKEEEQSIESQINESKEEKRKLTKEEKEKLKKERIERSKKKWEEKTKDLLIEQAKEKLLIWIKDQSIMIQNAFQILIIKDTIESVKQYLSQLQNTSIENQMDLLNTINNILDLFELFGLTPDAKGISMEDLKKLGLAIAGTAMETAVDMGNQVQNIAQQYTNTMIDEANANIRNAGGMVISQNAIQNAKGTVASISDKAMGFTENAINNSIDGTFDTGEVASNTAKAVGSEIMSGMVDQGMTNIIGAGLSMDMNAIANGDIPTIETQSFTYVQSNENKNIYIDITINNNPSLHLISITSFIKSFKSGSKQIFNNGATKQIKDAFKEAWEINDTVELKLQAIVDGVTKFYIFTFNVNQTARKNSNDKSIGTNIEDDLFSKAKNAGDNIKNGAMSTLNGIKDQTGNTLSNMENMASNAVDNIADDTKNMLSQLTKIGVNINADMIESVLRDEETGKMKILMFDEVVQFLKILQPIVQTLYVIAHILENYMINKEFVRTGQRANLADAIKTAAQLINGLKDLINLKDTNFFTIRTKEMADWAISEFKNQPDESGFITINILQTTVLNTYCSLHAINPDCPLDLLKGTTLYFDKWGINNGGYNDGTSNGLDNIEINRDLGEVYFDKQNRSSISSEILRARKKNVNPYYVEPSIEMKETKNDIKSFLDAITFSSDEIEGQQTLSICDLNLCPPQLENEKPGEESAVIIEFGDEYTLGNKVNYDLIVKPGQTLVEGDILGYIKNSGKQIPIRTQYTGTVRQLGTSKTKYSHLYPQMANRHIIIDNPVKCSASDYNIKDVMSLQQKFKKASELEALIINCMPLSVLPGLLVNATRKQQQSNNSGASTISGMTSTQTQSNTIYTTYDNIIKEYDNEINEFAEKLKNQSEDFKSSLSGQNEITSLSSMTQKNNKKYSEEKLSNKDISLNNAFQTLNDKTQQISSSTNSSEKTSNENNNKEVINISPSAAEQIKDNMLNDRKAMVELAISSYENAIEQKDVSVYGDIQYLDCVGLAYNTDITFNRSVGDNKLEYNNYYINLLRLIPDVQNQTPTINISMSDIQAEIDKLHLPDASINAGYHINMDSSLFNTTDMIKNLNNINLDDDGPNYIDEFKTIIKNIIDIRLAYEKQSLSSMMNVFTNYYNSKIFNNIDALKLDNAYEYLNEYIQENNIDKNNSQEILNKIKKDKLRLDNKATNEDIINTEKDDKVKKDNDYYEVCKQALTLFMYLCNADIKNDNEKINKLYKNSEDVTYIRNYNKTTLSTAIKNIESLYISKSKKIKYAGKYYSNFNDLYDAVYKNVKKQLSKSEENPKKSKINSKTLDNLKSLINADEKIINYLISVKEKGANKITGETKKFFEDAAQNNMFYQMIKDEAKIIDEFWKKVISEYKSTYNINAVIEEIKNYANDLNSNATWPQSINIKVDNTNYELYTFTDPYKTSKQTIGEIPYVQEDIDNLDIKDPIIDLEDIKDIRENDSITIFDYEYWLVYMLNATMFTLLPMYWADGFDIPPFMTPLLLPAIYLPIAPPVMIPIVNVLLVFGIALRGMWPAPIILMINLSSEDIDVMVFLKIALEIAKDIFKKIQETAENSIPMLVNELLNGYLSENEIAQKAIDKFRTYSSIIRSIPIENKALIEKEFNEALQEELNKPSKLNSANDKLEKTKTKLKNYDRRQVLTREADLGDGPAPM